MDDKGAEASAAEIHSQIDTTTCSSDSIDSDLQDIYGSVPDSPTSQAGGFGSTEYSDIPRLQSKHETNGYRDGISLGKERTVQKGFDEGFGLGAVIGMRVGAVLGLLEGVATGLQPDETGDAHEAARVCNLLHAAETELSIRSIFGAKWWGEDGAWRYDVPGEAENEVTFYEVAKAHPLLKKWETLVEAEVPKWNLDLKIFDASDVSSDDETGAVHNKARVAAKRADQTGLASPEAQARLAGDPALIRADLNW